MKYIVLFTLFFFSHKPYSQTPAPKTTEQPSKSQLKEKTTPIPSTPAQTQKEDAKSDKVLFCTEKGCNCEGKGCSFFDKRIIKNGATVVVPCSAANCAQKIVYTLKDKYGCKSSVQKMSGEDLMVVSECLIIEKDGPTSCPEGSSVETVEKILQICLELPEDETKN